MKIGKYSHAKTESRMAEALLDSLEKLPQLTVLDYDQNIRVEGKEIDLLIRIVASQKEYTLLVELKGGQVYSKSALEASQNLSGLDGVKMLGAHSLSMETRASLREQGVSYWDLSGSVYLKLPHDFFFVDREPLPQPREGRKPKNVFKGSTAQVVHQLLLQPERAWGVNELAKEAKVSAYTSQKVLEYLESHLWVEKEGRGPQTVRRVKDPGKILDAWTAAPEQESYHTIRLHRYAKNGEEHTRNLEQVLNSVDEDHPWALTLEHAANVYAPVLTRLPSVLTTVVSQSFNWRREFEGQGYKSVSSGENIRLLVSKSDCPFLGRERERNLWIASPIQVYLDLYHWPARGKEQALHLRGERIGF